MDDRVVSLLVSVLGLAIIIVVGQQDANELGGWLILVGLVFFFAGGIYFAKGKGTFLMGVYRFFIGAAAIGIAFLLINGSEHMGLIPPVTIDVPGVWGDKNAVDPGFLMLVLLGFMFAVWYFFWPAAKKGTDSKAH